MSLFRFWWRRQKSHLLRCSCFSGTRHTIRIVSSLKNNYAFLSRWFLAGVYETFDLAIRRLFKDFLRDRHSCNQSREENAIFMPKAFFLMPCIKSFKHFLLYHLFNVLIILKRSTFFTFRQKFLLLIFKNKAIFSCSHAFYLINSIFGIKIA